MGILTNFWIVQSIGGVGLIFTILTWNAKHRKKMLFLQGVSSTLFIAHYFLLGALSGALMCVIALARNIVFIRKGEKAWASHPSWFYIFSVISAGVLVFFWHGFITILPVVGTIVGTYGISRDRTADIRFYILIACIIWIPYTLVVHSYSGLLSQLVGSVAVLMGMYRHDRKIIIE